MIYLRTKLSKVSQLKFNKTCSSHAQTGKLLLSKSKHLNSSKLKKPQSHRKLPLWKTSRTSVILTKKESQKWNNAKERLSSPVKKKLNWDQINLILTQSWRKSMFQTRQRKLSHPRATSQSTREATERENKSWRKYNWKPMYHLSTLMKS